MKDEEGEEIVLVEEEGVSAGEEGPWKLRRDQSLAVVAWQGGKVPHEC